MTCKNICVRYKAVGLVSDGRYANGQKRCIVCGIYIKWSGLWCPCCGCKLRSKPRSSKLKIKLEEFNKDKLAE